MEAADVVDVVAVTVSATVVSVLDSDESLLLDFEQLAIVIRATAKNNEIMIHFTFIYTPFLIIDPKGAVFSPLAIQSGQGLVTHFISPSL